MDGYVERFNGQVTIKVRFRNAGDYAKFRHYIFKTAWIPGDQYPSWEMITLPFLDVEDLNNITKKIVQLLQMGLEVYGTNWKLEQQLAEEQSPPEDEPEEESEGGYIEPIELAKLVIATKTPLSMRR